MEYYRLKKDTPDAEKGDIFTLHKETNTLWRGDDVEYKTYNIIGGVDKWFQGVFKCKNCGNFCEVIRKDGLCVPCFDEDFDPGKPIYPGKRKCEKCGKMKLATGLNFPIEKDVCIGCLYPNGFSETKPINNNLERHYEFLDKNFDEEKFYRFKENLDIISSEKGSFTKDQIREMEKSKILERVWKCSKCDKWTSELTDANLCWDCIEAHPNPGIDFNAVVAAERNRSREEQKQGYCVIIEKWLFKAPQTGMYFTAEIEKDEIYMYTDGSAAMKIQKLGEEEIMVDE
jgi:hypothetical protein